MAIQSPLRSLLGRHGPGLVLGTLVLAGGAGLALTAAAGGPGGRDGQPHRGLDPEARIEQMRERLELEDDQVTLVRDILEDSRLQAREIHDSAADDRRAALQALRTETDARLAGVLTPVQMQTLEEARAERGEARRERGRARREGRFEHLAERLELAESQRAPVREILEAGMARGREAMQSARAEGTDRAEVRARIEGIRAETEAELAAVLTPAQMETLVALRAEREERGPRRHRRGAFEEG